MPGGGKSPSKSIQTDKDLSNPVENVPVKKVLSDFRQKIDTDHKDAKDKAVKELSARVSFLHVVFSVSFNYLLLRKKPSFLLAQLQKEFEIEKQEAVREALHKVQSQQDRTKSETEERLREEHHQEIEKLNEKHKEAISETKRKQWVCFICLFEFLHLILYVPL